MTLERSEVFDLLKPERGRALMDVLAISESKPVPVSSLAEEVAAIEYESTPAELNSAQRKRVYIIELAKLFEPAFQPRIVQLGIRMCSNSG